MMKLVCLILIVMTVERSYGLGLEEIGKYLADCKTSEKVSEAEIMNFKNKVNQDTKEAKCLTTCVMEKTEIIKNGLININGIVDLAKSMPNFNENTLKNTYEIVDECKSIKETERCNYGFKLSRCLMENESKRQLRTFY